MANNQPIHNSTFETFFLQQITGENIPVRSFLEAGHDNQVFNTDDEDEDSRTASVGSIPRPRYIISEPYDTFSSLPSDSRRYRKPLSVQDARFYSDIMLDAKSFSPYGNSAQGQIAEHRRLDVPIKEASSLHGRWNVITQEDKDDPYSLDRHGHNVHRIKTGSLRRLDP